MHRLSVESFDVANTKLDVLGRTSESVFAISPSTPETNPNVAISSRDLTPFEDFILHRATLNAGKLIFKGRLVRE